MSDPIKVLIVDDDDADRMHLRRSLHRSDLDFEVEEAASVVAGISRMGKERFDCAIVDYILPDGDARDFLDAREIVKEGLGGWPPIVVLTGHGSERIAVDLLKAGAADYLPKSELTPSRIAGCVRHALRVREITTQRTDAVNKLRQAEACCQYLFERFPEAIVIADSEGAIIDANPLACVLYQKSREEMRQASIVETFPQDRREEIFEALRRRTESVAGPAEEVAWVTGRFAEPMQVTARVTVMSGKPACLLHFRKACEGGTPS